MSDTELDQAEAVLLCLGMHGRKASAHSEARLPDTELEQAEAVLIGLSVTCERCGGHSFTSAPTLIRLRQWGARIDNGDEDIMDTTCLGCGFICCRGLDWTRLHWDMLMHKWTPTR